MKTYYAVYWESDKSSVVVVEHPKADKEGRKFWLGGNGLMNKLVFITSQAAHAKARQVRKDFKENHSKSGLVQIGKVSVKKVGIIDL